MAKKISIKNMRQAVIQQAGEVAKALLNTRDGLNAKQLQEMLTKAAQPLIDEMKKQAPKNTGALAQSITVWSSRKNPYRVWVGPSYKLGVGGRHAHLVEYGTAERVMKQGLRAGGITQSTMKPFAGPPKFAPYAGKRVGVMPAQPFIRTSVAMAKDVVVNNIQAAYLEYITAIARKNKLAA
jgi:HK97 gp10 family phage protein